MATAIGSLETGAAVLGAAVKRGDPLDAIAALAAATPPGAAAGSFFTDPSDGTIDLATLGTFVDAREGPVASAVQQENFQKKKLKIKIKVTENDADGTCC